MTEIDRNTRRRMLDAFKVRFHDNEKSEGYDDRLMAALEAAMAVRDATIQEPVIYISQEDFERMRYGFSYAITVQAGDKGKHFSKPLYEAPPILIDMCDHGHKFAKMDDHPKREGKSRCPHCMAIGLDAARAELENLNWRGR